MHEKPTIFLQEACLRHQYIRSKNTSNIVERPERLRAVNVGISAALSCLETLRPPDEPKIKQEDNDADDLVAALDKLKIGVPEKASKELGATINKSTASVDLLNNPAVKFVHGDVDGDVYLENLIKWAKESRDAVTKGESEIPLNLPQGDLYRTLFLYDMYSRNLTAT